MTINISLPDNLYKEAKRVVKRRGYASVSEFVRHSLRKTLDQEELTVNGFTKEFEDEVLEAAAEPRENDIILETEEDVDNFFRHLKLPKKTK